MPHLVPAALPDLAPSSPHSAALSGTSRGRKRLSVVPPVGRRRSSRRAVAEQVSAPEQVHELSAEARELLSLYTPLVRQIVAGFQRKLPRNVLRDDLLAAGMGGLWDAILKHGETRDDGFEWYVRVRVRGAILDELRTQDWLPRRARSAGDGSAPSVVRIDDVSLWEQARCLTAEDVSAEAAVEQKSMRAALEAAISQLPERERHIVSKHYFQGAKFRDLGAELGVSEPRVSQLHSRAMQRLRGLMDEAA